MLFILRFFAYCVCMFLNIQFKRNVANLMLSDDVCITGVLPLQSDIGLGYTLILGLFTKMRNGRKVFAVYGWDVAEMM